MHATDFKVLFRYIISRPQRNVANCCGGAVTQLCDAIHSLVIVERRKQKIARDQAPARETSCRLN